MKKYKLITFLLIFILSVISPSISKASNSFTDISNDFWAKDEIEFLVGKGIITGYGDGSFKPNNEVSKTHAAVMIVRSLNLDTANRPNPNLKDVKSDHLYYKEIATVIDLGIFPKTEYFNPTKALTRGEMAYAIVSGFGIEGIFLGNLQDPDIESESILYKNVKKLAANGITNVYQNGTFKPNDTVTRAQFSVFLSRIFNENFRKYSDNISEADNINGELVKVYINPVFVGEYKIKEEDIESYDKKYENSAFLMMYGKYSNIGNTFVSMDILINSYPHLLDEFVADRNLMELRRHDHKVFVNIVNLRIFLQHHYENVKLFGHEGYQSITTN